MSIPKEDRVKFGDYKLVNRKLTDEEKVQFEVWYKEAGDTVFDLIGSLCFDTWKCSLSWDNENDCYIHSATQVHSKHKNAGITVTSRSDVWIEAMALTSYKINVIWKGKKIPVETVKENWG